MRKQSYFFNNPTNETIRVLELNLSMPTGISDLFVLNENLSYEQIDFSMRNGTLRAAIENGLCYPIPSPENQRTFSNDIVIKNPSQLQVFASRTRFTAIKTQEEAPVFNTIDDINLFGDNEIKPAKQLAEELKVSPENIEAIEATIKQANLTEKPVQNRYVPPSIKHDNTQEKIKNDMTMGYTTCSGINMTNGKRCMRRAKTGKPFCGKHKDQ
jgi:hypothetical protein